MWATKQFAPEDVLEIEAREPDRGIAAALPNALDVARTFVSGGPCWTGLWNGKPVACGGFVILWPGVAEGWAYTSDWVREHGCIFHRAASKKFDDTIRENNLHRVQLSIPRSHTVSRNWACRLGFHSEGVMKKFGLAGEDFVRYARVS